MRMKIKCIYMSIILILILLSNASNVNSIETRTSNEETDDSSWWPAYRHDSHHTGFSTSSAPNQRILNWSTYFEELPPPYQDAQTPCVVDNGKIYIGKSFHPLMFYDDALVCLEAETGDWLWTFWTENSVTSSPVVYKGKVYFSTYLFADSPSAGIFYCLDADNGTELWRLTVDSWFKYAPTIANDKVYVFARYNWKADECYEYGLYCLNASTGTQIWHNKDVGLLYGSPVVVDDKLYIKKEVLSGYYDAIECLAEEDGRTLWQHIEDHSGNADEDHLSAPAYWNGKVYATTDIAGGALVYCLDAEGNGDGTTTKLWEQVMLFGTHQYPWVNTPSLAYGNVYASTGDYLSCYNATTGEQVWYTTFVDETPGKLGLADEKLFISSTYWPMPNVQHTRLFCKDAFTGSTIWTYYRPYGKFGTPSIANGKVYCPGAKIGLYCFGGANHPPDSPMKPYGPSHGQVGVSYGFSTQGTDFDTNDVQFGWDWNGDLIVDEWTGFYMTYPEPEIADITHTWDAPGYYEVRVKARDSNGDEGSWSDPLIMLIDPAEAELVIEINGGIGSVTLLINNIGSSTALDVSWSLSFNDGILFIPNGGYDDGTITSIASGEQVPVSTIVFGFGKTEVTAELSAENAPVVSTSRNLFLFGPIVIGRG